MSWISAGHVVGQAFWFGSLLVLAALLPPSAFGTVAVGLLMVTAATRLMEAGTRGSIIVAPRLTRQQVITSLSLNVAAGIVLAAGIALLAGPMARVFAHGGSAGPLRALGLSVALFAPAIVPLALLERRFAFKRRASVQAGATITASTLSVIAGVLGAGVWALVIRQVLFQALLAGLGWYAARGLLPARDERAGARRWERLRQKDAFAFLLFSLTDFAVFNADYLTVGWLTNTAQLGLYSLAYTVAFAPVTQFSMQLGRVLFPAAAASDTETMRRRTLAGVRLTCLALCPLVPAAIVLAPTLLPAVLGERWRGMVGPFQILVVVGVAHAVVNVVGESLSGTGNIGFRARVNLVWMVAMIGALILLVRADGIRGAALAHLGLYLPVALAYGIWGMRLLGSEPRRLTAALRPVAALLALQLSVTVALMALLVVAGAPPLVRDAVGVTGGLLAVAARAAGRAGRGSAGPRRLIIAARRGFVKGS
ncbi:MAG: oligosaccharide flippase family protein [Actinomycetota bacterium]|nr:oligosaccharide flippase family protein [Actinomycetota bacterium]